ncbi:MAG: helix-turn-helix transcriptional regulator [Clostridia bacterium]|nr:helix-turn-helix transcriptional regulator [Clostridia bacterium]
MNDIRFSGNLHYKIKNLGFVEVVRKKNFVFSFKNGKNFFSFIFVKEGALDYAFSRERKNIRIEKGQFLFIPKLMPYTTTYLTDNTHIVILTFDVDGETFSSDFPVPIVKNFANGDFLSAFTPEYTQNSLFLASKIYDILFMMEKENFPIPKKYKKLKPAIQELQKQYFKNEKIDYYAKLCYMSESNFRKLFKEYTGKSPIDYRNSTRISVLKNFLESGEFTVAEAAYLVGFNNMAFFYEVYNKYR